MGYLAELFPFLKRIKLPVGRDQVILLFVAVNLLMLGLDHYLAHLMDWTIKPYEWIPIIYGPIAGVVVLAAGLLAMRKRTFASLVVSLVMLSAVVIGVLGTTYHLNYSVQLNAPPGEQFTWRLISYGPPLLGPLTFILLALLGFSAAWPEQPVDSGRLSLPGGRAIQMPYSKTRSYFLLAAAFILMTLLDSVLDHARTGFTNPWLWLPTLAGCFATVVAWTMGAFARFDRRDLWTYLAAMGLLIATGLLGGYLHVLRDLTSQGAIVYERFLRGAPLMAPLLFANVGGLGLIVLLGEKAEERSV